ncbi:MAG: DNA-binding transcriptional LysR family regulator [Cyclobacteriaceae bacterium]|jgi:DNA-binding transcriptional LysR family regulator
MSYQLELRHFKYFKAVAEELSFRKAADKLFIAQPGLSRQIIQMEEILNAKLFERTKRNVQLTPAGTYLKGEVDFILNHLETTTRQVALLNKGESGEIRIGFVGSAIHQVLPKFMMQLSQKFPDIHTTLQELPNNEQIEAIEKDKLDIGFVRVSNVSADLTMVPVHEDTFSVVLPANHPISETNFNHLGQLSDEKFILFSSDYSPQYYDKIISICQDQGFQPQISHKSVHAFTIFKLVESGLGIAIVPTSLVEGYQLGIRSIELKSIPQRTVLSAIWKPKNRNHTVQNAIRFLFDKKV